MTKYLISKSKLIFVEIVLFAEFQRFEGFVVKVKDLTSKIALSCPFPLQQRQLETFLITICLYRSLLRVIQTFSTYPCLSSELKKFSHIVLGEYTEVVARI